MTNLIHRLEAAEGSSRDLDIAIKCFLEPHWDDPQRRAMMRAGEGAVQCPHYTASLDAAVSLVPEGCGTEITLYRAGHAHVRVWGVAIPKLEIGRRPQYNAEAPTPALALCIAALKAREIGMAREEDQ